MPKKTEAGGSAAHPSYGKAFLISIDGYICCLHRKPPETVQPFSAGDESIRARLAQN
jgi:hypothetical protein